MPWGTREAKYTAAFGLSHSQDRSIRFAAPAEKGADAAVKRLDTHFIDRSGEAPDIRCNSSCSRSSHEKSQTSRGRHAQAHYPPLRLGGDRRLLLILPQR